MAFISIISPTHNPQYLQRLAESIKSQSYQDYEWLIMPNGDCGPIPEGLPHARIIPAPPGISGNIGALKRATALMAQGDILLEVDHDDELLPNCLAEVAWAHMAGADFAYGNSVEVNSDGTPHLYSSAYGWRYRRYGDKLLETIAFSPSPASFSRIWYAPNHPRSWKREFYWRIGGHNEKLDVLDDQDLLIRTYLGSEKIKHVDRPLYKYHVTGSNTCYSKEKNGKIQTGCMALYDRWIMPMAEMWAKRNSLRLIDLGGAHGCPSQYESVDISGKASITCDLRREWPFAAGTVGVVRAYDIVEHLPDKMHTMKELHRVLAPGGWAFVQVPSSQGTGADADPTHVSRWNELSFGYWTDAAKARYIDNTSVRFQSVRLYTHFPSDWHRGSGCSYVRADLLKLADGLRVPGLVRI